MSELFIALARFASRQHQGRGPANAHREWYLRAVFAVAVSELLGVENLGYFGSEFQNVSNPADVLQLAIREYQAYRVALVASAASLPTSAVTPVRKPRQPKPRS